MQQILLDTDLGNDVDDLIAISMLCNWHIIQKHRMIGATSSKEGVLSGKLLAWLLAYYDVQIPVGYCPKGALQPKQKYLERLPDLQEHYPDVEPQETHPAIDVLNNVLQRADDQSITLIMIGNSTNIAHMLDTPEKSTLLHQKIRKIVWLAGEFDRAYAENNIRVDAPHSHIIFNKWLGPMDLLPSAIGKKVLFPGHHLVDRTEPLPMLYHDYMKRGWGRECWDPLTVLYACGEGEDLFTKSPAGTVTLDDNEITEFQETPNGQHHIINLLDSQAIRAEALRRIRQATIL